MHTRSGPAPALVDRQRERQALDSLMEDLRSRWRSTSAGAGPDRVCMPAPLLGSDSQGNPDLRKISRNLSLTFAAFGDTGQHV